MGIKNFIVTLQSFHDAGYQPSTRPNIEPNSSIYLDGTFLFYVCGHILEQLPGIRADDSKVARFFGRFIFYKLQAILPHITDQSLDDSKITIVMDGRSPLRKFQEQNTRTKSSAVLQLIGLFKTHAQAIYESIKQTHNDRCARFTLIMAVARGEGELDAYWKALEESHSTAVVSCDTDVFAIASIVEILYGCYRPPTAIFLHGKTSIPYVWSKSDSFIVFTILLLRGNDYFDGLTTGKLSQLNGVEFTKIVQDEFTWRGDQPPSFLINNIVKILLRLIPCLNIQFCKVGEQSKPDEFLNWLCKHTANIVWYILYVGRFKTTQNSTRIPTYRVNACKQIHKEYIVRLQTIIDLNYISERISLLLS